MSRPAQRDNSTAVSLFPFLAVLLCTMGALVVLLVTMAQAARQRAMLAQSETPAAAAPDPAAQEAARQAEERRRELEAFGAKAAESLRDDQLRLSQVEDHIRRLRDQLEALRTAAAELRALSKTHHDDRDEATRELERLRALIAETEEEIEELETEQASNPRSYAIVPYRGPNGTRRRPLYIECQKDRVILQPEGVELEAMDFRPPLGVGNPLSAALRSARQYYLKDNPNAGYDPDLEPYPLILVRPEGIRLYYRIRAALESGETDFGYEMIDGDWNLKLPLPNPELANLESRAIERSRLRRHLLARAAPTAYDSMGRGESDDVGTRGAGGGARVASGARRGAGAVPGSPGEASEGPGDPYSSDDTLKFDAIAGAESSGEGGGREAAGAGEFRGSTSDASEAGRVAASGAPGSPGEIDGRDRSAETGGPAASEMGGQAASGQTAPSTAEGAASAAGQMAGQPDGQAGGPASGSPSTSGGSPTVTANLDMRRRQGSGAGASGGEPARDAIAIRRPVSVVVQADRLVVTPMDRQGRLARSASAVVPLSGSTDQHLDRLVRLIREQVQSWGIAGRGFYWKPVLMLSVAPDGLRRADDIVRMLGSSGVDVRFQDTARAPRQEATGAQR